MTILSCIVTIVVLYCCCIVLYSIKRDWPPCKVCFRVGNQVNKCDKHFVCCYIEYRYVPSIISSTHSSIYGRVACSTVCTHVFIVTAVD